MKTTQLAAALVAVLALTAAGQVPTDSLGIERFAGLRARSIGPATMSGRVASVVARPDDPETIYVGASTGGLWRSSDDGLSWTPLTDDLPFASIGAVALHPANPEIVWIGGGEGNPRNSASAGLGVYRSTDGGESFTSCGLRDSRNVHRIVLHPTDPDVAWLGVLGDSWADSSERGVFRTDDGGKSWKRVLYVSPSTGCADLVADPANPERLYAAMWDFRRRPWTFRSGGPGSGLHVSTDGGETWKRLDASDGLPKGELGRIGLAVAPSRPERVYAYVESEGDNVIARSDDRGKSWRTVGKGANIGNRPFYYADLRVDPHDPDRVYSLWSQVSVSDDGGKSFRVLIGWNEAHPDHHAMWIDPADPDHIIDGNDGGIAISRDHGRTWRFAETLPLAQLYHVRVDDEVPYNVFFGLQDNGSWRGPSEVWESGGIRNHHWREVCFGDGFDTVPDPENSMRGYAMSQEGNLVRWDVTTGEKKDIKPVAPVGETLRFNWNAAIALDPSDPATLYFGSQFVHRSRDRGDTWEVISPDLTTDNPEWQKQGDSGGLTLDVTGAENFTSIVSIAPNPLEGGRTLWAGTDDGRLHVSRDAGASWTSLERRIPGVPANTWIPHIAPSPHAEGTAYVVFDDHRRGNWNTYLYETRDFGESWRRLDTRDVEGYALTVLQDPVTPTLLYLGTELGLWISTDGGGSFIKWTAGVPTVSVMDLALQERAGDLVVGTHGRGVFILDDVRPLRGMTAEARDATLHVFEVPDAWQHRRGRAASSRFPGKGEYRGQNRPYGAAISFWVGARDLPLADRELERERKSARRAADPEAADGERDVTVVVTRDGEHVRRLKFKAVQGLNRVRWDLAGKGSRRPGQKAPAADASEPRGPEVLPGRYTITVEFRGETAAREVVVHGDPRLSVSDEERTARLEAQRRAGRLGETLADCLDRIGELRGDLKTISDHKPEDVAEEVWKPLQADIDELREALGGLEKRLRTPPGSKGIPSRDHVSSRLGRAAGGIGSHAGRPTRAQLTRLDRAATEIGEVVAAVNAHTVEVREILARAEESGVRLLPVRDLLKVK